MINVLKKTAKWGLIILVILNLAILISGNIYLYKLIGNTIFKGRLGPSITEYGIFENREVTAGNYQKWNTSYLYNVAQLSDKHVKEFKEMETVSFLIIKNDSLIHEQYWDGYNTDSYSNSFSMAKTFVSILTGIAINEGKIKSIDQPVGDFLPEFKVGEKASLTIKHLLTMSSGINFDENYINPFAYPAKAYYGNDIKKLTFKYTVTETPGKIFKYLSGNTELLVFVLEKATGKTVSEYASEKLWISLGAKHNAFWSLDNEDGIEKGYCCFNSNAADFARIGQLYLDSGKWQGNQLVPVMYVTNSVQPARLSNESGEKIDNYGYSWWLLPDYKTHPIFYARGILGQYIICIPDKKMVIVRLGKKREKSNAADHPQDLFYYIDAALEMYGNKK